MKILVVEDDEDVLTVVHDCLVDAGHEVYTATSATAAARMMELKPRLELLVSDFNLGTTLTGGDVAHVFREIYPQAHVLMISGRPDLARLQMPGDRSTRLLSKPFGIADLLIAIDRLTSTR